MTRIAALLLAAALLAGCRSATTAELREQLSPGGVVLDVPVVAEDRDGACGLGCLVSLLRYHGLDLDDEARTRFPPDRLAREWIAAGELRDYLRGRGLRCYLVHGALDDSRPSGLFSLLAQRLPVIVVLHGETGLDHYAIACGFDPGARCVFLMDPARGIVGVDFDKFEGYWKPSGHFELVAARGAK